MLLFAWFSFELPGKIAKECLTEDYYSTIMLWNIEIFAIRKDF